MKKMMIVILVLPILLCGCVNPFKYGRYPTEQPDTIWETQDGLVSFRVPADGNIVLGVIHTETEDITIQLHLGIYSSVFEVTYNIYEEVGVLIIADEIWESEVVTKNKFVVEIIESNYFEEGEELVFYKVE